MVGEVHGGQEVCVRDGGCAMRWVEVSYRDRWGGGVGWGGGGGCGCGFFFF